MTNIVLVAALVVLPVTNPPISLMKVTNGCVECSYDLQHWYEGQGIVWWRHPLDISNPDYTKWPYEVIPINMDYNHMVFFRLKQQ